MRRRAVLALLAGLLALGMAPVPRAQADPIAGSFIFPVGDPNTPPTWDPGNGNGYYITQGFNNSCDPGQDQGYYAYGLYYCGHTGVDLASDGQDNTVHAAAAGVVTEAAEDGGYGVTVRLRHTLPDGQLVYSQYEHLQYGSLEVYQGQTVGRGQALGLVGATGFANGTHLHFELKTFDGGGPGYTFGNQDQIAPFFDPLPFVSSRLARPVAFDAGTGRAVPEWPAETDAVLTRFLAHYKHFVVVDQEHGLNVRAGPGTRYPVKGVVLRGAKLGYLKSVGAWLYVALPQDVRGWVGGDLVSGYLSWARPWPPRGPLAEVDAVGLRLHSRPGERHPVLGLTFQGDTVAVERRTAHWTLVRTREGARGWALSRFLTRAGVPRPRGGGHPVSATAPVLRVRRGPGVGYQQVGTVFQGTALRVVRLTPHWAAVVLPGGTTGWVAREYTSLDRRPPASHGTSTRPVRAVYVRVAASVVNIRKGPGERHPVVARAMRATRLQVLSTTAHWARVALPASRLTGWVLRRLTR